MERRVVLKGGERGMARTSSVEVIWTGWQRRTADGPQGQNRGCEIDAARDRRTRRRKVAGSRATVNAWNQELGEDGAGEASGDAVVDAAEEVGGDCFRQLVGSIPGRRMDRAWRR